MSCGYDGAENPPGGIRLLFRVMLRRLLSLMGLSLLFFLCALPLVTLPAACSGLMRSARLLLRETEGSVVAAFFRAFRSEFFKTAAAGLPMLGLLVFSFCAALYYWSLEWAFALPLMLFCLFAGICLFAATGFLFAMTERVSLPPGRLLKNAFLLPFLRPYHGLAAAVCVCALQAVLLCLLPYALPVFVLVGPAFSALIMSFGMKDTVEAHILNWREREA